MRSRDAIATGIVFLLAAVWLGASQVEPGGQRLLLGLLLAGPWAASGVTILIRPRVGAWLGFVVATVSLGISVWIVGMANAGQGRDVAELLFAAPDGTFSWAGVLILAALFAIACLWCAGAAIWLLVGHRVTKRPR